jgi:uncharacterized protein YhhL (DUF1145 family)
MLLQWKEPPGARTFLLRMAGGLRSLFFRDLLATGVPIVLFMLIVWLFALVVGADVMPFPRALLLFAAFSTAVSVLTSVLYLAIPHVRITSTQILVGMRVWGKRSIRGYDWETHPINGTEYAVLHLSTRGRPIRVALSPDLSQADVERALISFGLQRTQPGKA